MTTEQTISITYDELETLLIQYMGLEQFGVVGLDIPISLDPDGESVTLGVVQEGEAQEDREGLNRFLNTNVVSFKRK